MNCVTAHTRTHTCSAHAKKRKKMKHFLLNREYYKLLNETNPVWCCTMILLSRTTIKISHFHFFFHGQYFIREINNRVFYGISTVRGYKINHFKGHLDPKELMRCIPKHTHIFMGCASRQAYTCLKWKCI